MVTNAIKSWPKFAVLAGALLALTMSTGCELQTNIAGQTLPSPFYLRDDVQFFPAGPEERLPIMKAEIARYKAEQAALGGAERTAP
ncbi:MAG: hypothetical protein WD648_00765 [Planctomycetaceae bacterium]